MRYMWDNDELYQIALKLSEQLERAKKAGSVMEKIKNSAQTALQGDAGKEFELAVQENIDTLNQFAQLIEEQMQRIRRVVEECYVPYDQFVRSEVGKLEAQLK